MEFLTDRMETEIEKVYKRPIGASVGGSSYVFADLTGVDNLAPVIEETNRFLLLELV